MVLQPKPKRVTPHGEKILKAIQWSVENRPDYVAHINADARSKGWAGTSDVGWRKGWATRDMIAWAIKKKRLNAYDIAMLELLANEGMIEAEFVPPPSMSWQYRVKK